MRDLFKYTKKAARVLLAIILAVIVATVVKFYVSRDGNYFKNNLSTFLKTSLGIQTSQEVKSVLVPSQKIDCNEKDTLKNAKSCTLLIGNTERHGTGFMIDNTGTIITNYHVIDYSEDGYVNVFYNGEFHRSPIVGFSIADDLAVIKTSRTEGYCTWANSDELELAESVFAVGWPNSPYGESTITKGIFSRYTLLNGNIKAIQMDTPINPGNSGGPLVNKCGVVGINTSKALWSEKDAPSEGIGYAISSIHAKAIIADILSKSSGSPAIPTKKLSQNKQEEQEPAVPNTGISANTYVAYDYDQVIFWEQRRIHDSTILDSWERAKSSSLLDKDKLNNLISLLKESLDISDKLWDGYTNSTITYGDVINLKQRYLQNSNEVSLKTKDLNIEGSINAYRSCLDAWDDLEKEYDRDFSEKKKECDNLIQFD